MKPLSLDMSDPLTLGLNLGMGHPVTERIRRLSMRKTNLLSRSASFALIVAALGLTAPVFTSAVASPVMEVADSLANKALEALDDVSPTLPLENQNPADKSAAIIPNVKPRLKKYAEAKPRSSSPTGLKPTRLRMTPRFTNEQIVQIQAYREAIIDGNETARKDLNNHARHINLSRFELTVSDQGDAYIQVSDGSGGWPGYPANNTGWKKRPLSTEMQRALKHAMTRCAATKSPIYFMTDLNGVDSDIQNGTYEVECISGSERVRNSFSDMDLAKAYLESNDLPLEKRQGNFNWKMPFAMFNHYVKTTPNATISSDRAECVRIYTLMKQQYGFTENSRKSADYQLKSCATKDYNWVRKRENIPEVQ